MDHNPFGIGYDHSLPDGSISFHVWVSPKAGNTSLPARTAQGGGGSFKDRNPIGEVGCSDAWMAEWLERRPIYRSIYLPV